MRKSARPRCSCPPQSRRARNCRREWLKSSFSGKARWTTSRRERWRTSNGSRFKARCASRSGTRRARRRSWECPTRRCSTRFARWDWRTERSGPAGAVQQNASEVPGLELHFPETASLHQRGQVVRRGKSSDGSGKIRIGFAVARDRSADARKNLPKIKSKERGERTGSRLRKFEDSHFATRLQNARELAHPLLIIRQIPKAERRSDQIEGSIGIRKVHRVGGGKHSAALAEQRLGARPIEHGEHEVAACDRGPVCRGVAKNPGASAVQRESQIARAAAQIQHARVGTPQNRHEAVGGAAAPDAVERKREEMIQEIVAGRDPREHFLNARGGLALVVHALRAGTGELFSIFLYFCAPSDWRPPALHALRGSA